MNDTPAYLSQTDEYKDRIAGKALGRLELAGGSLVQIDQSRNAILGTPLARGLHSVLLRADPNMSFDRATNSFVFSSPQKLTAVTGALLRMVEQKAFPVEGTYASSLTGWYDALNGRESEFNNRPVIQFRSDGEFSRALKGLSMIEDAVHIDEPKRFFSEPNAIYARAELQELGVVYLPDAEVYLGLNRANDAAVRLVIAKASEKTEMQRLTLIVGMEMLGPGELRNSLIQGAGGPTRGNYTSEQKYNSAVDVFIHNVDRFSATNLTEELSNHLGPKLAEIVDERFPNLKANAEATIAAAAVEATAARAAAIMTETTAPQIESDHKGSLAKESDVFADREAEREKLDPLRVLPIEEMHPKAGTLAALGAALREIRESGEATIKGWRLAKPHEIVTAPVAAQNRDWIVQRNDDGMGIIHQADILDQLMDTELYKENALDMRPKVVEDLRVPVTLGVDRDGITVFEQPEIAAERQKDPAVAWAIGFPKGGDVNSKEFRAASYKAMVKERNAINSYALSGHREVAALALAELARRGVDASDVKHVPPEPTNISRPHRGEVVGTSRDGMYTSLYLLPRPENKPPRIMTLETIALMGEKAMTGDIRKGDHFSFGFEKVADTIMPSQVTRVASPEQAAALAASRAASMVDLAKTAYERTPQRLLDQALQKYTEWHRGKTGFAPQQAASIVEPESGKSYAGPLVGFAGKYAIQNIGPDKNEKPQIVLHDCDIIPKSELPFVSADMVVTLAYHQEERNMVDPINVTDARPLRDYGFAFDADLANELKINDPVQAATIERGVKAAATIKEASKADKTAVLAQWATGEDIGR